MNSCLNIRSKLSLHIRYHYHHLYSSTALSLRSASSFNDCVVSHRRYQHHESQQPSVLNSNHSGDIQISKQPSIDDYYTASTSPFQQQKEHDEEEEGPKIETRTASISLVGAPNAGKSSLSNALIECRISAVSRKINTTRRCTTGIYTNEQKDCQLVMYDTPGLLEREFTKRLTGDKRKLSSETWGMASESDFALFIVDTSRGKNYWKYYANIASQLGEMRHNQALNQTNTPNVEGETRCIVKNEPIANCLLVLNKCDVTKPHLKLLAAQDYFMSQIPNFKQTFHSTIFVTSAYRNTGVQSLRNYLLTNTSKGDFLVDPGTNYFDDHLDVIRQHIWEKLLHRIHKEVPYKCSFENDRFHISSNGDIFVSEVIRAPSKVTCYMIVGRGGDTLRWIKETAQQSASEALQRKVTIKLTVVPAKDRHGHIDSVL